MIIFGIGRSHAGATLNSRPKLHIGQPRLIWIKAASGGHVRMDQMRQPFRDVAMDAMAEELDHLKILLNIAEDPALLSQQDADSLKTAIADLECRISERRRRIRN